MAVCRTRLIITNKQRQGGVNMDWANIINAIGVIVVAYFTYNQYTKNKVTDYKLEKWKAEDKVQNKLFRKKTMIGKIFEKISTKPNINLTFDWTEYPEKEMSMLMEYFDVSNDDIANYIYKTYFNENIIKESILKLIQKN